MALKKNDFSSLKKKFSSDAKYKPQRFFDLGPEFLDAVGLPGPAIGHLNMLLGHSDTGKTTALIKTAVDAQKKGILPVFIITCLLYTSPSPRDRQKSRMPSSA